MKNLEENYIVVPRIQNSQRKRKCFWNYITDTLNPSAIFVNERGKISAVNLKLFSFNVKNLLVHLHFINK